ncbi:MAG: winged helix-turn-helix domain-containing protein [Pyrinomonadaceae bacterium]|nr:winged helix-turn-helix domain-containing protein [Pyrinomonadaceae bacterium]
MNLAASRKLILIVEDVKTSFLLSVHLEREGFETISAHDGRQALELFRRRQPAFTILDPSLPDVDGREVCRELRRLSDVPILILTAKGGPRESVTWLTLGADDYVTRPFSPEDLVARVKAILRRTHPNLSKEAGLLSHHDLVLDLAKHKVTLHGRTLALTRFEYKLLQALMAAPGKIFLRDELLDHLYPTGETVIDRVIDVHIGNLRQKIEEDLSKPRYVLTARGMGYKFADGDWQPEEDLLQAEKMGQSISGSSTTGIYLTTVGGRYQTACPMLARMFGYESTEKLVENTVDLNHGFYVERERRAEFAHLVRERHWIIGFESEVYRRDGSHIWISEHAIAIYDTAGDLVGFQGTTEDITERRKEKPRPTGTIPGQPPSPCH